jgi:hypothetical protein
MVEALVKAVALPSDEEGTGSQKLQEEKRQSSPILMMSSDSGNR